METPDKIPGYSFNEIVDKECNWRKCWALIDGNNDDPYIIQMRDGSLWVVPCRQPEGTWGSEEDPSSPRPGVTRPKPQPDTSTFAGPFDSFELAFATFTLMVTE